VTRFYTTDNVNIFTMCLQKSLYFIAKVVSVQEALFTTCMCYCKCIFTTY